MWNDLPKAGTACAELMAWGWDRSSARRTAVRIVIDAARARYASAQRYIPSNTTMAALMDSDASPATVAPNAFVANDVANADAGRRHLANAASSTYRYRNEAQRRAYMRDYMRGYRATKAAERRASRILRSSSAHTSTEAPGGGVDAAG
jgi:hypothetical protein